MNRKHEYRVKQNNLSEYKNRLKQIENEESNNLNVFNNFVKVYVGDTIKKDDNIRQKYRRYPTILDAHSKMLNRKNALENERSFLINKIHNMTK